ncbi:hypothetical protein GIB67_040953 [Kingdonia uniflora]|uniref:Methylenetetrahydrofolate reductase n=1 Tax=Kingdonia uniflora TaxID=39325 RepID=A0A7J7M6C6_9MAGN|nr:hypothetical protein GIB67_040953 [Kingdonia uniflora]
MKVIDKIKEASTKKKVDFSFEFFPPKIEDGVDTMFEKKIEWFPILLPVTSLGVPVILQLISLSTFPTTKDAKHETMMHLTCTNMPVEKIDQALDTIKSYGIQNFLALRGNPPHGYDKFVKTEGGFAYALDLVKHTREKYALTTYTMKACLLEFEFGLMKKMKSGLMRKMVIGYWVKGRDPLDYFGITVWVIQGKKSLKQDELKDLMMLGVPKSSAIGKAIKKLTICKVPDFGMLFEMDRSPANEVSTSGRIVESKIEMFDSEVKVGDEQFPGFPGKLVTYPPCSNAFKEFYKTKATVGGTWGNCVEYAGRLFRGCTVATGEEYFYLLADLEEEKRDSGIDESISLKYFDESVQMGKEGKVRRISPEDVLQFYGVKNYHASGGAYFCASTTQPRFFDLNSSGRSWNDNVIWVKGPKSQVERKDSLLDEVAKEEVKLESVLEGLGLSRKERVGSKFKKVQKSQSTRLMAGVEDGKKKGTGGEGRTNLLKSPRVGGSVHLESITLRKLVRTFTKKYMLKRLSASSTTGSGEVEGKEKRRRIEPSRTSGEKVVK